MIMFIVLEFGTTKQTVMHGTSKEGVQLVRNRLVISVDCEHRTGIEHIVSASATNPMTQVGHEVIYILLQSKN
jgi:hypothetical protein